MAIGSLAVRVTSDTTQFNRGMSGAGKTAKQLRGDLNKVAKKAASVAAAVAGVGAALTAGIVIKSGQAGKELKNFAAIADTSTTQFRKMAIAAREYGVEQDKLADILKDTKDRVGDFITTGGGPMADFFETIAPKVGVTAEQFRKLSGPQALQLYVSSLEKANLSQSEMTFFMEAMASDATALLPLLKNGGKEMAAQAREAEALGLALSEIDVERLSQMQKEIEGGTELFKAATDQLGAELAPAVSEVSKRLTQAIKDAGGLDSVIQDVVESGVRNFGRFLDVLHGVRVSAKTLTLGFQGFGSAALGVSSMVLEGWQRLFDQMLSGFQGLANMVNAIPGVPDIDTSGLVNLRIKTQQAANDQVLLREEMSRSVKQTASELQELAMMEMPSKRLADFFEEAKAKSDEAARSALDERNGEGENGEETTGEDRRKKELQQLMTFEDSMTDIAEKGAQAREDIAKKEAASKKIIGDAMAGLTTLMNSENRKMFEVGKAAAIGQSLISTWQGMSKALELGWPMGPIAAAAIGATGFANVQSIRSQSFGSGGGGAGSATQQVSGNQQPVQQQAQQETTRNVRVEGLSPGQFVQSETVMEAMEELWKDGAGSGRLIFGGS